MASNPEVARQLFAPLAPGYERWSAVLSMGQDPRWRRRLVGGLELPAGSQVLDLAAGTGLISRTLAAAGHRVVAADLSPEMVGGGRFPGPVVLAAGEALPFRAGAFDGVTFGYLLRYVDDVAACLAGVADVLRPGGRLGMLEFARPRGVLRPLWWLYTRAALPAAGALVGSGWRRVGGFLGPSIDRFADRWSPDALAEAWEVAGFEQVRFELMSLGGGLIMWGTRS
jgi:demethylmenaquinone methyltransferase/2-methoxy-6-polyprenyl-1,4-benzoquinol methylase